MTTTSPETAGLDVILVTADEMPPGHEWLIIHTPSGSFVAATTEQAAAEALEVSLRALASGTVSS